MHKYNFLLLQDVGKPTLPPVLQSRWIPPIQSCMIHLDLKTHDIGVYFELKGRSYANNSAIRLIDIGEGENALFCKTNKQDCCTNRYGQLYYPNGVQVPIKKLLHGFYRNRGERIVRLNRKKGILSPIGRYQCEIPDADGVLQNIYITLI